MPDDEFSQYQSDLEWIMSSVAGRRVIGGILTMAGLWRSSFDRESEHGTDFSEGMRYIGLHLYRDLEKYAFSQLLVMMKEAKDDRTEQLEDEPDS